MGGQVLQSLWTLESLFAFGSSLHLLLVVCPWGNYFTSLYLFFPLSSFTFIKRLFSSSSLSARRVVSSVMKEESEKVGLKLSIQKMKIMASGPIISWQIDGKAMETVTDFIFLGSKIMADGDCSLEIKRRLLLGRKAMTKLDSILKSRDITLPIKKRVITLQSKVCLVKAMDVSHVWMWQLLSCVWLFATPWTI